MKILGAAAVCLFLGWTVPSLGAASQADPFPPAAENFFKWGEYDSLQRVLEPWLKTASLGQAATDSHTLAKAHLYLGVAYYSLAKAEEADQAFVRACRLDARVRPDPFYVSKAIAARYDRIVEEQGMAGPRKSIAPPSAVPGKPAAVPSSRNGGHSWIWWTAGGASLAAAGTFMYFMAADAPSSPRETITSVKVQ